MTRNIKSSSEPPKSRRLKGDRTGEALIAALQDSPHRDIEIEPQRAVMPVRAARAGFVVPLATAADAIKRGI